MNFKHYVFGFDFGSRRVLIVQTDYCPVVSLLYFFQLFSSLFHLIAAFEEVP
jgi:hypothetical protein